MIKSGSQETGFDWRRSSGGQSMRFIPAVSLVRVQSPLPDLGAVEVASTALLFFCRFLIIAFGRSW